MHSKIKKDANNIKLVGFVKCFNEGKTGNLERCLNHLASFCDDIVICDDSSTDNSLEIARRYTNNIIVLPNDFKKELEHKQKLLELALSLNPDWIVSLDPDEIFDREGELNGIRSLCVYGDENGVDSFSFQYYNLWKGENNFRVDELWYKNWQPKLWKNKPHLKFDVKVGLHLRQYPLGLNRDRRTNIKLIHYGFISEDKIEKKYLTYQSLGQTGRALQRIKDEEGIILKSFSRDWYPPSTFKISVVCLIYKSVGYAKFVYESFHKYTKGAGKNVDFLFIANDPTDKLLSYLEENSLPHLVFRNKDQNEHYLKRVYRAWNYGGMQASGNVIVFVNSDMSFSEGWLDNLIRNLKQDRIVTSRLVESGKLRSGKYGVEMNFGRTYSDFQDLEFQEFVKKISMPKIKSGGLFMPCAIYKDIFIKSGGYPIGNRTEKDGTITPGDKILFYETLKSLGIQHYTVFDSIVYHIQEGEMDI
ncbi:MAG: glycosyltransferase [Thaumarchaeota archaeon]|nr:glycosyltransferase [Nitrososphaerota archaeon]